MPWASSHLVDIGTTTTMTLLHGSWNRGSQTNGVLRRVNPLAAALAPKQAANTARYDAEVTHPNPLIIEVNGVSAGAVEISEVGLGWAG